MTIDSLVSVPDHSLWLNASIINVMISVVGKKGDGCIVFQKALVSRNFVTNNSIGGRYLDYCWKFANIFIIDEHDDMFRAEGLHVFPVNYK